MTLTVIGSGLGRTGTRSMRAALNVLGFGPCHYMNEVFRRPERMGLWVEAAEGRPDWDGIFEGYRSMIDHPGAVFWREIAQHYPDAKVVHTVRDPEAWFESTQATIWADVQADQPGDSFLPGPDRRRLRDRAYLIDYFRSHTEAVKAAISPERLLVYEVGEGWDRLCKFLDVPVPAEPFPFENARAVFGKVA